MSSISEETSRHITALRFFLAVLVVFIHNNYTMQSIADSVAEGGKDILFCPNAVSVWIQRFISNGIARCAVPLFFLFSAYLLFMKNDRYCLALKKRVKSLVIPFFIWPVLNIAAYILPKLILSKIAPQILQNPGTIPFLEWNATDWLHAFFGYEDFAPFNPIKSKTLGGFLVQMWFVRDLFILVLISPALKFLARKFPALLIFCASSFYLCGVRPVIVAEQAFFYFMLGLFWAEYDLNLFAIVDKIKWKEILPVWLILFCVTYTIFGEYSTAYWLMVFASCVMGLKISAFITQSEKAFAITKHLAPLSFFVFAFHIPLLLGSVQTLWLALLPMKNALFCLAEYFGVSLIVIALATAIGQALRKICPPVFALLNGGRG